PEEESAMNMALQHAKSVDADIVLGTDPDTDRVGIGIKNKEGHYELLNGNQAAVLIIYYAIEQLKKADLLGSDRFVAKTIVTTQLIDQICEHHKINCYNTLTGFKYIAEQIRLREGNEKFIAGGEESYGYLIGDYTRDKDAVVSSLILCEIAAWAKSNGKNLIDLLSSIYKEYGFFKENLVALTKKGRRGSEEIQQMMDGYRNNPPKEIIGKRLLRVKDFKEGIEKSLVSGNISVLDLPKSNVIQLFYEDALSITARPSGTEPKIKFYLGLKEKFADGDAYQHVNERLDLQLLNIKKELGIA
ncbi:MAG: phospho-sugar mutase, partial [Bacteroidota bacterium]